MIVCKSCARKKTCVQVCAKVEDILNGNNHSLRSNYLVKFVSPQIIEEMRHDREGGTYLQTKRIEYLCTILKEKMKKISKNKRWCLIYYYGLNGNLEYTQEIIARLLHISQNSVKYHLMTAKHQLKELLDEEVNDI